MSMDIAAAKAASLQEHSFRWDADRVILYHLGVGAGADWLNPTELAYTYEDRMKVLPTFAVVPSYPAPNEVCRLPAFDFEGRSILHGEHEIEVMGAIPAQGEVVTRSQVLDIYDRGSGALVLIESRSHERGSARLLFVNRWSLFVLGEGGFGGQPGPKNAVGMPSRAPDAIVESPILPQLPQIFRLSGDKERIHIDPEIAAKMQLGQPIVHGLCTFGVICKAIVDRALDGDVTRVRRFRLRFAKPLHPGDTVVTSLWREAGRVVATATSKTHGHPVATQCLLEFNDQAPA